VIRGEAPGEVLRKQQDTLETIHLEFASQLNEFSGDTAPFAAARPLIEGCLETVLTTTQSSKKRGVWLRWAVPLLLIVAIGAGLWIRSTMRWHRALAALRAEPGYVVVDASRGWSQWNISGLKDPSARDPRAVIASAGLTPPALSGQWQSFLSLDPALVAARAKQWSAVDSLRQLIERDRILFEPGSAEVPSGARARLREVAALIDQLDRRTAALGGAIRVQLTGRTDPTGADETNQTLAQRRVDGVSNALVAAGVPPSRLVLVPVATAKPLISANADERARINRSVAFDVTVSATPLAPTGAR
jgi:OOP family OmpA-OmpF porin